MLNCLAKRLRLMNSTRSSCRPVLGPLGSNVVFQRWPPKRHQTPHDCPPYCRSNPIRLHACPRPSPSLAVKNVAYTQSGLFHEDFYHHKIRRFGHQRLPCRGGQTVAITFCTGQLSFVESYECCNGAESLEGSENSASSMRRTQGFCRGIIKVGFGLSEQRFLSRRWAASKSTSTFRVHIQHSNLDSLHQLRSRSEMQGIEATLLLSRRLVTRNSTCRYSPGCRTTLRSRIREEGKRGEGKANGKQPRNQMHKVAVAR